MLWLVSMRKPSPPLQNPPQNPLRIPLRIVVLLSGRGSNLAALIQSLRSDSPVLAEVIAVVSDKPTAPGLVLSQQSGIQTAVVSRRAKEQSALDFENSLADHVLSFSPDLIVLAGFMRILTEQFINRCGPKIINIHPSLLPAFRGMDAQNQALLAGVKFSGCTVHLVTPELDGGPILDQAVVPVRQDDTRDSLAQRILDEEHRLLPSVVKRIALGEIKIPT